jgi:uncharacterized DUF497 family protein
VEFEWDDDKAARNVERHGIAFRSAERFDWESAVVLEDRRRDYGEVASVLSVRSRAGCIVWFTHGGLRGCGSSH